MAVRSFSGVRASEVNPSFLHANSTSHTWIFSAFAELIDNAYDPDVAATQLWIEKRMINGQVTLVFVDNGNGMNPDRLHKMLSFGFSDKQEIRGHRPIGQYGNGFKSGSMRLGKDVLVFTRQRGTMSVGFLSQTYLQTINAKTVFVPIVTWRLPSKQMVQTQECYSSLKEILRHSIFRTEKSIIQELDALGCIGHSGTEIIIYNLKRDRRGNLELDFESDPNDILNPQTLEMDRSMMFRPVAEPTPAFRRSLREYCSILYLKPRMKIMLRGEKVKTKLVSRSLSRTEKDVYKPHFLTRPVKIIFGFSPSKSEDYGILMYHKNRLIIAYEKVGYQKQANELGVGVVGVVELNFLEPIHNKQDFNKTTQYNSCVNALGVKLNEYWNEKTKGITPGHRMMGPGSRPPDWLWAQCDKCLKWRRLPPTVAENQLPKKWFCHMNLDATRNRCDIPEESEDDDDMLMRPSYEKTYKKQMEERKRQQRFEQMRQMQNREKQLQLKEAELKQRERERLSVTNPGGNPSAQGQPISGQSDAQPVDIDIKPDEADLLKAQLELTDAKRRETQQTKLIEQLQQQKDMLEQKQRDVLKIAESITIKQIQDTEKTNGPNESLEFGGVKRGIEGADEDESNKRTKVVTADGEVVYVVKGDDAPKPVIDLTMSDDEDQTPSSQPTAANETTTQQASSIAPDNITNQDAERDIKPDLDELDRRIAEAQRALGMVDDVTESVAGSTAGTESNPENAGSSSAADPGPLTVDNQPNQTPEIPLLNLKLEKTDSFDSEQYRDPKTNPDGSSTDQQAEAVNTMENEPSLTKQHEGEKESSASKEISKDPISNSNDDDNDFAGDFGDDFGDDDDDDFPSENADSSMCNGEEEAKEKDSAEKKEDSDETKVDSDPSSEKNKTEGEKSDDKELMEKEELSNSVKDEKASLLTNGDNKPLSSEIKPKLSKVVKSRGIQTLPVEIKGLLAESLNFSKLAPSEIHHLLVQRTNELEGLRRNVRELLRIILPEVDLGTPDCIDQVVQEVIRVNQIESSDTPTSVD